MITVNRHDLIDVLKKVFPAVGLKENNIQANCFVFRDGFVHTYNDDIYMYAVLPTEDFGDLGDFAIQAKEFLLFLNKMTDEEIELDGQEGKLIVKGRRVDAEIISETEIRMPIESIPEAGDYIEINKEVVSALKSCAPVCSKDLTKPLTTCVRLFEDTVEVSDVDKAVRYKLPNPCFGEQIFLPGESAKVVSRYPITAYALAEGWIYFSSDADNSPIIACRTYYDNQPFVDLSELMGASGTLVELPANTIGALERSEVFTSSTDYAEVTMEDKFVTVEIAQNWCVIKSAGGLGQCKEKLRTVYDGPKIAFSTKVEILAAAIDKGQHFEVCNGFVKIYDESVCHVLATALLEEEERPKTKKGKIKDMDDVPF